jgi:hypothetical protein
MDYPSPPHPYTVRNDPAGREADMAANLRQIEQWHIACDQVSAHNASIDVPPIAAPEPPSIGHLWTLKAAELADIATRLRLETRKPDGRLFTRAALIKAIRSTSERGL